MTLGPERVVFAQGEEMVTSRNVVQKDGNLRRDVGRILLLVRVTSAKLILLGDVEVDRVDRCQKVVVATSQKSQHHRSESLYPPPWWSVTQFRSAAPACDRAAPTADWNSSQVRLVDSSQRFQSAHNRQRSERSPWTTLYSLSGCTRTRYRRTACS